MEYEFLVTAFYLSVLSYYLGTLFYMLPLPFYSIKKWAPTLMVDGVFSAVLVFTYTIILSLIDYIGGLLGSDWTTFYLWLSLKSGAVASLIAVLRIIGLTLSASGHSFIANSMLSPLIQTLTYTLLTLLTIMVVSIVITSYGSRLLALGILLHAVPFRLTRASGSMLISIVIVFTIGLPLMPLFVEYVSAPLIVPGLVVTEYGLAYTVVNITDATGSPIPYAVLEAHRLDSNGLLARYMAGGNGVIDTCSPDKGLPGSKEYGVLVEIGGAKLSKTIAPWRDYVVLNNSFYQLDIGFKKLVTIGVVRFVYLNNSVLESYYRSGDYVSLTLSLEDNGSIDVVVQYGDELTVYIDGVHGSPVSTTRYAWYGVELVCYRYGLPSGVHTVDIYIDEIGSSKPVVEEVYYLRDVANITLTKPVTFLNPIAYIVFNLLIAPIAYIAILVSTSYALARLLGGSRPSILYAITLRRIG